MYTAQTLITRAWYLSGIIARNLQQPSGDQITDGLFLLNALLDFKQIETDLIPYSTYIEMPLAPNQEFYFLPNVAAVELATFNIGVVRYPMDPTQRDAYYGSSRVDNISTLPFNWNYNRGENGGTFATYFLPQSNYPLKMMVKLFLNDVSLNMDLENAFSPLSTGFISGFTITSQGSGYITPPNIGISAPNLSTGTQATAYANISNGNLISINIINPGSGYTQVPTVTIDGGSGSGAVATASTSQFTFLQTSNAGLDSSYIEYLRYSLARYMCSEYGIMFNPESAKILQSMERKLMYITPPDLSQRRYSILSDFPGFNWGDVSIGRGWRPS